MRARGDGGSGTTGAGMRAGVVEASLDAALSLAI
jgi:hypothetical protein